MGTPNFAVPILKTLNESKHKILEVYTQPPSKKNRGQKIESSPIQQYSDQIKLKVRHPSILNTEEELKHLSDLKPNVVIVVAYGKILPTKFLDLKNILFINIHASLLPKWRGAAPIHRSIMSLNRETGVSIMKIIPKLDAGPVMLKSKIKIKKETNFDELSKQLSTLGSKMILESLHLIENNKAKFTPQNESEATYAKKIDKEETKINWNENADRIIAKINAFSPKPGCWFNFFGSRVKVIKAREIKISGTPGEILDKNFTIACFENAIQILELKKEGRNKVSAKEFLRGNNLEIGFKLL